MGNLELNKYHYVIQGWSASELIVTNPEPLQYSAVNLNNDRVPDVFHKIPNTNTWISSIQINTMSFDQKVFLAALVSRDRKFLSKKDAKKIIKRLKLLFPDELKLIKDCADEITQKVKL